MHHIGHATKKDAVIFIPQVEFEKKGLSVIL